MTTPTPVTENILKVVATQLTHARERVVRDVDYVKRLSDELNEALSRQAESIQKEREMAEFFDDCRARYAAAKP